MYARKRERELKRYRPAPTRPQTKGSSGAGMDHTKYVLKSLEEIDTGELVRIIYNCIYELLTPSSVCFPLKVMYSNVFTPPPPPPPPPPPHTHSPGQGGGRGQSPAGSEGDADSAGAG